MKICLFSKSTTAVAMVSRYLEVPFIIVTMRAFSRHEAVRAYIRVISSSPIRILQKSDLGIVRTPSFPFSQFKGKSALFIQMANMLSFRLSVPALGARKIFENMNEDRYLEALGRDAQAMGWLSIPLMLGLVMHPQLAIQWQVQNHA